MQLNKRERERERERESGHGGDHEDQTTECKRLDSHSSEKTVLFLNEHDFIYANAKC